MSLRIMARAVRMKCQGCCCTQGWRSTRYRKPSTLDGPARAEVLVRSTRLAMPQHRRLHALGKDPTPVRAVSRRKNPTATRGWQWSRPSARLYGAPPRVATVIPLSSRRCRQFPSCSRQYQPVPAILRYAIAAALCRMGNIRFSIGGRLLHHYMGTSTFSISQPL